MKNLREYKILGVVIMVSIGLTLAGCGINKSNKSEGKDYKEYALETLQERYGEEFEIKQVGGTFAAYRKTKKLICNPVDDKDQFIFVEVEPDLSEVYDNYINKIMSDKLFGDINKKAKEIFGENTNTKLEFYGFYNKYTSLDMDAIDFLNDNIGEGYGVDIFIKADGHIDIGVEAEKLDRFTKNLLGLGIKSFCGIDVRYIGEGEYNKVDEKFNKLQFENKMNDYYKQSDQIYNSCASFIEEQKQSSDLEELISTFKTYN